MPKSQPKVSRSKSPANIVALAGLGLAAASHAQGPPAAQLPTITVTGSRLVRTPGAPATRTVIDAAAIQSRNKPTVPELLADVAGLHTNQPGSRGSVGELFMRGGEPNFTAVLVDGVPMNDPTNTRGGSFDFSTLDINEVEAIEILRGPFSSIYGSDALSGIVNIITHRPVDELESGVTLTAGGEDLASANARIAGPLSTSARFVASAGSLRDGRADSDAGYRNKTFGGSLEFLTDNDSALVVNGRHSEADLHGFPDSSGGPSLAVLRERDRRQTRDNTLGMFWRRPVSSRTELNIRTSLLEHSEDVISPGVAAGVSGAIPPNRHRGEFSRDNVVAYLSTTLNERLSTALGLGFERQQGESDGALTLAPGVEVPSQYALARDNVAIFGELGLAITQSLNLSAALRYDDNDSASRETTSKIGVSYSLRDGGTRLRLGWAQGFKLPSLFSLGDPLVGNPALESETVTSWEVGADVGKPDDRFTLSLTAFAQHFENLIDFDFEQFTSVNRDAVDADGLEVRARYHLGRSVSLLGHGTWVDLDVRGSNRGLRQRPKGRGGLGFEWTPTPSVTLYAGLRYVGERLDESIPTGERSLPRYTRADASLAWRLSNATSLRVAIDNLTDERYEDAIGFPSLGARLRVTLRTTLLPRR